MPQKITIERPEIPKKSLAGRKGKNNTFSHKWMSHDGKGIGSKAKCTKCGLVREITSRYISRTEYADRTVRYFKDGVEFKENQPCK